MLIMTAHAIRNGYQVLPNTILSLAATSSTMLNLLLNYISFSHMRICNSVSSSCSSPDRSFFDSWNISDNYTFRLESPTQSFRCYAPKRILYTHFLPLPTLPQTITRHNYYVPSGQKVITHLTFSSSFNEKVHSLPPSIVHITFGDHFNRTLDHLPPTLSHLVLGKRFNQSVDRLPTTLMYLKLGARFNKKVDSLPPALSCIIFGANFDHVCPPSFLILYIYLYSRLFSLSAFSCLFFLALLALILALILFLFLLVITCLIAPF
jgi:hypothetical protein